MFYIGQRDLCEETTPFHLCKALLHFEMLSRNCTIYKANDNKSKSAYSYDFTSNPFWKVNAIEIQSKKQK